MDGDEFDSNKSRIETVKAALNLYGQRLVDFEPAPALKKEEQSTSRTRELHKARRDISRINESRKNAESAKSKAESELFNTKMAMKYLTSNIQDTNLKAKARIRDLESLKKQENQSQEWDSPARKVENYQYEEVMRELEIIKQDLSKLKLDVASVLAEKSRAEKETEASSSKVWSYASSVDAMRKEIDEINEEQVLAELARFEADKEFMELQMQRKHEADEFLAKMEKTRKKINDLTDEIDRSKELEAKLVATNTDSEVLRSQLNLVKEMEKRVRREDGINKQSVLKNVTEELEAAKKELANIKAESFQFMASMDVIREELKHVTEETHRLDKTEQKVDLTVQSLNSKLFRAKSRLESVSGSEEKAKAIAANLSLTVEQLRTESEAAKREREIIAEETVNLNSEVQKAESEIELNEESLRLAMEELDEVKSLEEVALENLKNLTEKVMRARASVSQESSTITISNFEYEYLTGRAGRAEEIADKKVSAAQAWIEAIKASEKEILMKIELAQRKMREKKMEEENDVNRIEKPLRQKREKSIEDEVFEVEVPSPRKSMKDYENPSTMRRGKFKKLGSPMIRVSRSSSLTVKRKQKVMPNISNIFGKKEIEGN